MKISVHYFVTEIGPLPSSHYKYFKIRQISVELEHPVFRTGMRKNSSTLCSLLFYQFLKTDYDQSSYFTKICGCIKFKPSLQNEYSGIEFKVKFLQLIVLAGSSRFQNKPVFR